MSESHPVQNPLPAGVYDNFTYQCECGATVTVIASTAQPHTCTDAATANVLEEVAAERERQDAKWGEQNHPNGTGPHTMPVAEIVRGKANAIVNKHYAFGLALQAKSATDQHAKDGTVTFADILLEEVFEALADEDPRKLRTELIQVAAVAAQWVEAIDRAEAKPTRCDPSTGIHSNPHVGCILR